MPHPGKRGGWGWGEQCQGLQRSLGWVKCGVGSFCLRPTPPLDTRQRQWESEPADAAAAAAASHFQGEIFTAANSKGRKKKSLTNSGEDSITQHELSNLLGRLFREILVLKANIHDPKIRDGNQSWYEMWKGSLHSECLKRSDEHRKWLPTLWRLLVPPPLPPFLAEGWTESVPVSAPPALDSSLHAAPPPACFLQTLSLCLTGDASKLRPIQQQVDFFFPFFLYGNYSRRFSQLNCIFFFTELAVRHIYPDLPPTLCRNDSLGTWSTQGCKTVLTDASHTKCLCDRLSTFAILAQQPREIVSNKGKTRL